MNLAHLRQEYMRESLDEKDVARDPITQFNRWFDEAAQARMPIVNAMTLATASTTGRPAARIVLLKGADHAGFVFYTSYDSRKGREIAANPHVALLFHWTELEREVRIEGRVEKVSAEESDRYFAGRPLGARLSACASPQSEPVADRAALERLLKEKKTQYGEAPPRPPHWGGFRVVPEAIEFWQGRADRLHDRLLYRRGAGAWSIERLAP